MSQSMLLNENFCSAIEVDLVEASAGTGPLKFKGKFQEAEAVNKNKRMYPFGVLDENVKRLTEVVNGGGLIGELDHPSDSIIHFKEASHKITKLWWEGNVLMGEGVILNTAHGRQLRALINDGVRVGISSRGVGNGKVNENGILVIGESYKLITFDAVADPSTFAAFQERIATNKIEVSQNITTDQQISNNSSKNESTRIYTTSKEAIIAALGGIFREGTNRHKARLNS